MTVTQTATRSGATSTATNSVSESISSSGTVSQTATAPAILSYTDLTTNTESLTRTLTFTATITATSVLQQVPDLSSCDPLGTSCYGTKAYCYLNSGTPCDDLDKDKCNRQTPGDFCRYLNADDSGRSKADFCPEFASGRTCRYQAKACTSTATTTDTDCGLGDYCVAGTPAQMCRKTGYWCDHLGNGCNTPGDACVSATSRLMMVKNAVRRVVLEHAYDDTAPVKIGHMHTYQADRNSLDPTKLFPYVKLQTTSTRTDVKYLPRSELLKGVDADGKPCFSETAGPSGKCTIDYGAGGATTTPEVTYSLQATNNSRYAVPTGDGKTYARQDTNWTDPTSPTGCGVLCPFPSASTAGYGLYEGSYYTFSYTWGQPVDSGTGSVANPVYSTTYLGKSYSSGGYWYLMDAERTEYVNENKYGANEFTSSTWSKGFNPPGPGTEYRLPLVGAHSDDPLSVSLSGSATCGPSNGAQWDYKVVPMVNDTSVTTTQKALMNAARLEKASYGGFYATGNLEPIACTLKDENGPNDKFHSVDGYMSVVQGSDSANNTANGKEAPCWENHVLLVVDGLPRGPGDVAGLPDLDHAGAHVDCSASACMYDPDTNPNLDGCHCPAVTRARALAANGVNVHVIAATTDLDSRNAYAAATLNNIARAGSTDRDFINIPRYAASEDELYYWLNYEMKEALRITVATTPGSAASGSLSQQEITAGNSLFQTTVELPEWRGNLVGFGIGTETVTTTTTATATQYKASVIWDAAAQNKFRLRSGVPSQADRDQWKQRRVFFSDATGQVRSVLKNDGTGTIDPGAVTSLLELKLGANPDELTRIVEWMLGKTDPNDNDNFRPLNPAVMGSVLNSVPIDVGAPGASTMPGGNHFMYAHANRPELVYVGADDGMLHAFQAANGTEVFAFIPADQIPTIAKLYAQGGQRYSPNDHIYGLAGSPKVKNVCVANCNPPKALGCSDELNGSWNDGTCPQWKTILVVGDGPGGNHPFALDITDPFEAGVATLDSSNLLWHVGYKNAAGIPAAHLGETDSVPAFAYHQTTDQNDYRVLLASGYPSQSSDRTYLIDATASEGASPGTTGPGAEIVESGGPCPQEFTALADVAVARDYTSGSNQNLLAAYVGDTWGTLHQYAPGYGGQVLDNGGPPLRLGCHHPLHFSPAVVQLTRVNASSQTDAGIFLAQVTNSILDPLTVKESSDFPASMLVVAKLSMSGNNPPALDQTFGSYGTIQLSADPQTSASTRLCGVTAGKASTASDCGSGGSWLPASARPTGTPVAIIRSLADGFQILTTWYDPPAENWDNCPTSPTSGNSYVTLHEFLLGGTWAQLVGFEVPHQYVTGVQFVGTTVFITTGDGSAPSLPQPPGGLNLGQNFQAASKNYQNLLGDRFVKTAWSERLDAE